MGTAYGYLRVSRKGVGDPINSLENQRERIARAFDYKLKPLGMAWGTFFADPHVSGRLPLGQREGGARLDVALARGDHVLMAKLDRGFRSVLDLANTIKDWEERGIVFHFLDLDVDTSAPAGKMMIHLLGIVAQFERERIAERVREAHALRKAAGLPGSGHAPYPYKYEGKPGRKVLVTDPELLRLGASVLEWRRLGYSWREIVLHCRSLGVTVRGRSPKQTCIRRLHDDELARLRQAGAVQPEGNQS